MFVYRAINKSTNEYWVNSNNGKTVFITEGSLKVSWKNCNSRWVADRKYKNTRFTDQEDYIIVKFELVEVNRDY